MSSQDFEMQRPFNRVCLLEPWPSAYGLSHGAQTAARPPLRRDTVPHECLAALHDLIFLSRRQQILQRTEIEPHGSDNGQHDAELDAQDGDLPIGGSRAF